MIIMNKSLSRRTVLRGVGVTLALPFLDAMVPALGASAKAAALPKTRLAAIEIVHGARRQYRDRQNEKLLVARSNRARV